MGVLCPHYIPNWGRGIIGLVGTEQGPREGAGKLRGRVQKALGPGNGPLPHFCCPMPSRKELDMNRYSGGGLKSPCPAGPLTAP